MSLFQSLLHSHSCSPAARSAQPAAETASAVTPTVAPTVTPRYEITESDDAFALTVHLPGVAKDGLEITAEDARVRIVGRRGWQAPEVWTALHRETADAAFKLELTHDRAVEGEKIGAELRDGVLRVSLPKREAIKPRKIAVN